MQSRAIHCGTGVGEDDNGMVFFIGILRLYPATISPVKFHIRIFYLPLTI